MLPDIELTAAIGARPGRISVSTEGVVLPLDLLFVAHDGAYHGGASLDPHEF